MERETHAKWARLVERWARSGLTAKRFAAKAGINARTLQYYKWKWRLGQDREASSSRDPRAKPEVGFVELRMRDLAAGEDASGNNRIEIVLPSGTRVVVPNGVDAGALRRVVDALETSR